jgi:hypothetical protein
MDGFTLELGVLASHYTARLIKLVTTHEGLRMLRQAITFRNFISTTILLFYVYECGSQDDIDSFFDFFTVVYLFSISDDFKDILTVLGVLWLVYYVDSIRYPQVSDATQYLKDYIGAEFKMLHTRIWVFFSLEDGHHVGREPDKNKPRRRLGIPNALRPPTIDDRPQITPQQAPGGEVQKRSSSGTSVTSVTSRSGQRNGSGKQNGCASGSKRGTRWKR